MPETTQHQQNLKKYAQLLTQIGINLRAGEGLIINLSEDGLPLGREVAALAYQLGAKDVLFQLMDDDLNLIRYQNAVDSVFDTFPEYKALYTKALYDDHYQHMFLVAPNPLLLKDINPEIVSRSNRTMSRVLKDTGVMAYRMSDRTRWTLATLPSAAWASLVFPDLSPEAAVEKLWQHVFQATRVDQPDPVAAWMEHDKRLKYYAEFLNHHDFASLHYQAPGTDLTVGLADGHQWVGGSKSALDGVDYFPNIPTEELFTTPHRAKVNGALRATMPLSLNGIVVDGFDMVFKDGKLQSFTAQKGEEVFARQIAQDEGASYLGEVALVPVSSPIYRSGIIFQNTLFDENASCHFALGQSYSFALLDSEGKSPDELKARGANDSIIHTDFMVGSPELTITAIAKDGHKQVIMEKGEWTI